MTRLSPPPPPPHTHSENHSDNRGEQPKPKKAWSKPIIRRLVDGVVVTESGAKPHTAGESAQYRPQS